mmetsp:Transcript_23112/g.34650  ORF Transcript_23112/g.34650 Transcript_23112/m.34650 type:complete len:145 (+) Transcript_23112:598-1032(+)
MVVALKRRAAISGFPACLETDTCDAHLVVWWHDAQFLAPFVGALGIDGISTQVAVATVVIVTLHFASSANGNIRSLWHVPRTQMAQWILGVARFVRTTQIRLLSRAWVRAEACGIRRMLEATITFILEGRTEMELLQEQAGFVA